MKQCVGRLWYFHQLVFKSQLTCGKEAISDQRIAKINEFMKIPISFLPPSRNEWSFWLWWLFSHDSCYLLRVMMVGSLCEGAFENNWRQVKALNSQNIRYWTSIIDISIKNLFKISVFYFDVLNWVQSFKEQKVLTSVFVLSRVWTQQRYKTNCVN